MTKRSADNRPQDESAAAPIETSGFADTTGAPETPAPAADQPMPQHGGSFIRQPDGSLTLAQED